MNNRNYAVWGIPFVIVFFFLLHSFFIVPQMRQAIVLQFGEIRQVMRDPGLQFKVPFVEQVIYYDRRMLDLDIADTEVTMGDQKRVVVNTFTRYTISNPEKFYKTVLNEHGVRARLSPLITGTLRGILGKIHLGDLLSSRRSAVMHQIRDRVSLAAKGLGIDVVEVRMKRADLPKENSEAIFHRMVSERRAEAAQIRAKGEEIAEMIRANTDRECTVIKAEAQREAQVLIGRGKAEAAQLYREAYGKSTDFAFLYRTLEAYRSALAGSRTSYVLSPESDFLKFLGKGPGKG